MGARSMRAATLLLVCVLNVGLANAAAKEDPELQELARALAQKKAAIHALSTQLHTKKIPVAAKAVPHTLAHVPHVGGASSRAHVVKRSALLKLDHDDVEAHHNNDAEAPGKDASNSLLKEDIDDKMVGDFSKSHNKNDHRMMNGKFDWLLRASAPLYTAAKSVSGNVQHQLTKALVNKDFTHVEGGASLQEQGNATSTEEPDVTTSVNAAQAHKADSAFLDFSQEKEGIWFATWIVVLVVVLGVLGLCVFYARTCLGAKESHEVPAHAKKASLPGGGSGYGSAGR
jgi:hypothetical protein